MAIQLCVKVRNDGVVLPNLLVGFSVLCCICLNIKLSDRLSLRQYIFNEGDEICVGLKGDGWSPALHELNHS